MTVYRVPIQRQITCVSLSTVPTDTGTKLSEHLYGFRASPTLWNLTYHLEQYSHISRHWSSLVFNDTYSYTQKLLADIFFYNRSDLSKIGDLEIHGISIGLEGQGDRPINRHHHDLTVTGRGRHSFVDNKASEFSAEIWTNEPMNMIIDNLVGLATKELPEA
jgi:hypothetical protein